MDKKAVYIYTMKYYSDIKKNTFESVLIRWMKLESIIHSEVSQKEKHQYSILGQGGLACCNSWGGKEVDMIERLN